MANILVVDDDDDVREAIKACLEFEGYAVEAARNGEEALALLLSRPRYPSLVVTDLRMPICDGRSFARRLQELPSDRPIPCLILSAERDPTLGPGVAFLSKPFDLLRFVATVAALVESEIRSPVGKQGRAGTASP